MQCWKRKTLGIFFILSKSELAKECCSKNINIANISELEISVNIEFIDIGKHDIDPALVSASLRIWMADPKPWLYSSM